MAAFMKLGDIKGEFAPSRQVEDNGDQVAQFTTGGGGDSVHQQPDTSDPGPGNRTNWDAICDVGTAIKQTSVADALTNYRPVVAQMGELRSDHIGALKPSHVRSVAASADNDSIVHLADDAIVGTTGTDPFSELDQGFETGLPVGSKLRSDNRFVIEPVNLFQGLDAGSMNYAEAIGMDSSTVGVMNNVISSLQPANEII